MRAWRWLKRPEQNRCAYRYVASNPQYADSTAYASKFRQLHGRALATVRAKVQQVMRHAAEQVCEANLGSPLCYNYKFFQDASAWTQCIGYTGHIFQAARTLTGAGSDCGGEGVQQRAPECRGWRHTNRQWARAE